LNARSSREGEEKRERPGGKGRENLLSLTADQGRKRGKKKEKEREIKKESWRER